MMITITSIRLKSPWMFFTLSYRAMKIMFQLKNTDVLEIRKRGLWKTHYTLTAWKTEHALKDFAHSGAHLEAMKKSAAIAEEIRTLTLPMESIPNWKVAQKLLFDKGKCLRFQD
jgi:hypothetical protein